MAEAAVKMPALSRHVERTPQREGTWGRLALAAQAAIVAGGTRRRTARLAGAVQRAGSFGPAFSRLGDGELAAEVAAVRLALRPQPAWPDGDIARALACVGEMAVRTLGKRPYDGQLLAAHAALRGMAVEMATGEGKTIAAGIAAAVAALAGTPVHLATVNAYLAERDAEALRPLYAALGLRCGVVTDQIGLAQRRSAYACDVVVCTGQQLAFDYMRDRLAAGRPWGALRSRVAELTGQPGGEAGGLIKGLRFAIVDEADSLLIDEARTPLILAVEAMDERDADVHDRALAIASCLRRGRDYELFANERRVALLPAARAHLARLAGDGWPWDEPQERERLLTLALTALQTLQRNEHYLLRDGRAAIIDEYTGRTMADRSWSDGLQEMVDRKEGLKLSPSRITQARLTYQRFFRRYQLLSGMSGTLSEVAAELWTTYRLPVAVIPRHRPDGRVQAPLLGHADETAKWAAIVRSVAAANRTGAPVLIGTRTVASSERASAALARAGLLHAVLSAAQPAAEATVVARAGQRGAVTVATNMAGRGTDIRMGSGAANAGGLHVVISEQHDSRRIDRQLAGRCGRQGDPGRVMAHVALDDALLQRHCPTLAAIVRCIWVSGRLPGQATAVVVLSRLAQRRAERLHRRMRRDLLLADDQLGDATAFAGEGD